GGTGGVPGRASSRPLISGRPRRLQSPRRCEIIQERPGRGRALIPELERPLQTRRKNPWLLPGLLLAVAVLSFPGFGFFLWRQSPPPHEYLPNSIGVQFVRAPPGKFLMGSPDGEKDRADDEGPQHEVEITRPFYLGVCEVTQGQYEKVMGTNPA